MRIGLFIPCFIDAFFPEVGIATLELLERFGRRRGEGAGCCVSADSLASLRLRMTFWWRLSDRHTSKVPGEVFPPTGPQARSSVTTPPHISQGIFKAQNDCFEYGQH
jgi:hypothetical protein